MRRLHLHAMIAATLSLIACKTTSDREKACKRVSRCRQEAPHFEPATAPCSDRPLPYHGGMRCTWALVLSVAAFGCGGDSDDDKGGGSKQPGPTCSNCTPAGPMTFGLPSPAGATLWTATTMDTDPARSYTSRRWRRRDRDACGKERVRTVSDRRVA